MTTQEEVAFIHEALKQRFFASVPKRTKNQTEPEETKDRLSRCLAAYALVHVLDLDDQAAVTALTDGGDDGGIDAFYFDQSTKRLVVVQSKSRKAW